MPFVTVPPFMRMRVETPEGVLVVFDAARPTEDGSGCSGYSAYWTPEAEPVTHVFGRVLNDESDLEIVLQSLHRDFGVDVEELGSRHARLTQAMKVRTADAERDSGWEPLTLDRAVEIMGFDPSTMDDSQDGGARVACACTACAAGVPPPSRCDSPYALVREALGVVADCCGCGGPPPPPCRGKCCYDPCCGDPCCGDPCCGDPCCGDPCCGDRCCAGSSCCHSTSNCCGGTSDPCCGSSNPCCHPDNPCCSDPVCCGDPCCQNPCWCDPCFCDPCCQSPCSAGCGHEDPCDPLCGDPDPCCPNTDPCDPDCGDPCLCMNCDDGNACTDDYCSGGVCVHPLICGGSETADTEAEICCGGTTCCPVPNCCPGGICCPFPCNACITYGFLSGGAIAVDPNPACAEDTITFTLSGVMDNAGTKRGNCEIVDDGPGPLSYTWTLTLPPGYPEPLPPLTGSGATAIVIAKAPGTYSCTFTAHADRDCAPAPRTIGPATAQSPEVVSVEWVTHPGNTALDGCPNNGGKRILPDKISAVDGAAAERPKVDLVVHISPTKEGCNVHLKVWDVDDPFDQNNPGFADVALIDNNTNGPDNRPLPGEQPWTATAVTGANGQPNDEASVAFTVSMQPGNNYRAGASVVQAAIDGTTQTQADDNAPPQFVYFTDMLTVWRRLHVELDSMGAVTGNQINTPFTDIVGTGTALTGIRGLNSIDDGSANLDKEPPGNGRFENGTLTVGTAPSTITISPITANGETRVVFPTSSIAGLPFSAAAGTGGGTMSGTITGLTKGGSTFVWFLNVTAHNPDPIDWAKFVGGTLSVGGGSGVSITGASGASSELDTSALNIPCTIHDDDDDTLLPKLPDTSTMGAAYQPAYVVPVYDVGDNNMNVPFVLNVRSGETVAAQDWDSRSPNAPDFWVAYLLESYQCQASDQDNDPDSEDRTFGATPSSAGGSLIFLEVHQSHEGVGDPVGEEQDTVVHETGHAVGDSGQEDVTDFQSHFLATYLVNIRSSTRPSP